MRRIVAVVTAVLGVALILSTIVLGLFQRTAEAERTLDRFAAGTSPEGFTQFLTDYEGSRAGADELTEKAFPRFARDLGMTQAEFDAFLARDFAALDQGIEQIPSITGFIDPIVAEIDALPASKLAPVYDIPIQSLPVTSMAWMALGLGVALLGLGIAAWLLPGRAVFAAVGAVGAAMAIGPIAISLPSNTNEAADIVDLLRVALSEDIVRQSEDAVVTGNAIVGQLRSEFLPEMPRRLEISEVQLGAVVDRDYPAAAKFLADWDEIDVRIDRLATNMRASVDDFDEADALPYELIPWLFIGLGVLLVAASIAALFVPAPLPPPVVDEAVD